MPYYAKKDYDLKGFRKSKRDGKKYDAILVNKKTGKTTHVPFGASSYEHYRDSTGEGVWTHQNHLDEKRRKSYRARHVGFLKEGYYSPGFFSYNKLW